MVGFKRRFRGVKVELSFLICEAALLVHSWSVVLAVARSIIYLFEPPSWALMGCLPVRAFLVNASVLALSFYLTLLSISSLFESGIQETKSSLDHPSTIVHAAE